MPLLRTERISKHFGGLKALDGVDLVLEPGQILGVIGPNGAGKTTLFTVIAGSQPPTSGRVFLEHREVTGLGAHRMVREGIVRTHQIVRPFSNLTVLENVTVAALHGAQRRTETARERAEEVVQFVGLGERRHDLPSALTLAGRKRLELARALATGPKIVLLDEVVAGLNPTEAQWLAGLIRRIRDERGVSIVMIEHVMPAVMSLSDRVIVLDYGKKISEGTPPEVAGDPRVVEAYLGRGAEVRA
jgi:branched-chain amino acid transport system ATP-binding protein